ncbi:MAG: FtsQ-type POTRA domain-containing protein [Kiritimatiellae bacterium]|nr:FtsQ-type POTRA domain-containing protein [Kiritimatiellia bacterium]
MKENTTKNKGGKRLLVGAGAVVLVAAAVALAVAYGRLRDLWLEQCVITDPASQVSITDGKMVRADVVAYEFGLRRGVNLATIDFDRKRADILKKIPNIRSISVARRLPNRVEISVEERVPLVRLGLKGQKNDVGRVADAEGVVFISSNGTQTLPVIRESAAPGTPKGGRLSGRARAALLLLMTCRERFRELGVIEVDVSKPDYLVAVLADDYSTAKIAWDGMDDLGEASLPDLVKQLGYLSAAYGARVDNSIRVWDATQPGKVYGNTQKGFL